MRSSSSPRSVDQGFFQYFPSLWLGGDRRPVAGGRRPGRGAAGAGGAFHPFAGLATRADGRLQSSRVAHARRAARRTRRGSRTHGEPLAALVEGPARRMRRWLPSDTGLSLRAAGPAHSGNRPPVGARGSLHRCRRLSHRAAGALQAFHRLSAVWELRRAAAVDLPTVRGVPNNLSIGTRRCGGSVSPVGLSLADFAPTRSSSPPPSPALVSRLRQRLGGAHPLIRRGTWRRT